MNYSKLPTLETKRLILRPVTIEDTLDIFDYAQDPDVSKMLSWDPSQNLKETEAVITQWIANYQNNLHAPWVIEEKNNKKVIGTIDCRNYKPTLKTIEVGYCLSKKYWGKGFMGEALEAVTECLFTQSNIMHITALVRIENIQSQRVLQKNLFSRSGKTVPQDIKGERVTMQEWILSKPKNSILHLLLLLLLPSITYPVSMYAQGNKTMKDKTYSKRKILKSIRYVPRLLVIHGTINRQQNLLAYHL